MIDIKILRENPQHFIDGATAKNIDVAIPLLLEIDEQKRSLTRQREEHRAEQKRISKEIGPQIGKLKGQLKSASEEDTKALETKLAELEAKPSSLKAEIQSLDERIATLEPQWNDLLLHIPQHSVYFFKRIIDPKVL